MVMPHLTSRESDCLHWLALGKSTPEIGTILGISVHTVRGYTKRLRDKFDCVKTAQVIAKTYQNDKLKKEKGKKNNMASYSYKRVMYRDDFLASIEPAMKSLGCTKEDYDDDSGYDGDGWLVAEFLLQQKNAEIERLQARVKELEEDEKRDALDSIGWDG